MSVSFGISYKLTILYKYEIAKRFFTEHYFLLTAIFIAFSGIYNEDIISIFDLKYILILYLSKKPKTLGTITCMIQAINIDAVFNKCNSKRNNDGK